MTKKPRTLFVLRHILCNCPAGLLGCTRCNSTGYRTEHVPLADALQEVEEENAHLYLKSVSQSRTVGKGPSYLEMCNKCGGTSFRVYKSGSVHCEACDLQLSRGFPSGTQVDAGGDASPEPQGCPRCGSLSFYTKVTTKALTIFDQCGTLRSPVNYGGFVCSVCGVAVAELPIPKVTRGTDDE